MTALATPPFQIPAPPVGSLGAAPAFGNSLVLDAASEKAELICDAPATGNIRKIHWGTRGCTVTGSINVTIGIETLNRTATPSVGSGTPWGTNTNNTQAITSADDNVRFATTLTADAAVEKDDPICIHWTAPGSGTFIVTLASLNSSFSDGLAYPYSVLNGALLQRPVTVALEYDDGSIYPIYNTWPASALTATTFASGSTPNTIGERFQLTSALRCAGFWLLCDSDDDFTVRIVTTAYHRANGTGILASRDVKKQDRSADGAGRYQRLLFPTAVELDAATNYRFVIEPGATGITIYDLSVNSLAELDAIPGSRTWHLTTANNPTADGDWTNHNSGTFRRLWGGLIFDGVVTSAGGVQGSRIHVGY